MGGSTPASSRAFTGAVIQRVIAKIAAAGNPADKSGARAISSRNRGLRPALLPALCWVDLAVNETHLRVSRDTGGITQTSSDQPIASAFASMRFELRNMTEGNQRKAATACAGRAAREAAARPPPAEAAPLHPSGFAVAGSRRDEVGKANRAPGRPERTREHRAMADDAELQLFRSSVNCAAVLEGMVGGWRLDVRARARAAP